MKSAAKAMPGVLHQVRVTLLSEARIALATHPIEMNFADGALFLEGEVANVAAKKLVLERAAAVTEVRGIVDRVRVAPAQAMEDGALRVAVCTVLLQEGALAAYALRQWVKHDWEDIRIPPEPAGEILVEVRDGVVTLSGNVRGLGQKRLAGLLCWWVPGSRDVVNGLEVAPPEADNDAEITDAVRLALEKDPFVDAGQVLVGTHGAVVTLRGQLPSAEQRDMAEFDAWYIFGVDRVINEILVQV